MFLKREFFKRKTELVARDLLGKFLVRKIGRNILAGMVVETEAYVGPHDLACHASKGRTKRTEVMFGPAGVWYVYMIYGMYYCLNIVTEEKEYPSAILIRALEPSFIPSLQSTPRTLTQGRGKRGGLLSNSANGPGKLCKAFQIDKNFNCTSAVTKKSKLYFEDRGIKIPKNKIIKTKRIGVEYSGQWKNRPLRFYIKGNRFISKP